MNTPLPFRLRHLLALLEGYEASGLPLDAYVSRYFRAHSSLGSHDRAFLNETLFSIVRWRGLLDYLIEVKGGMVSWRERIRAWQEYDMAAFCDREDIPLHIRVSFPKVLFDAFVHSWGKDRAKMIALASNAPAPVTVRVNVLKTTQEELIRCWTEAGLAVSACQHSPVGIRFHKRMNFFTLPEFSAGLFEVQDEASQLVALLVKAKVGDHVLDFCAGSGGKTLAFAPHLAGSGQIYLHDVRRRALLEAKKRLNRAGIQNAQFIHSSETRRLGLLRGKMDWVLVDAPCSGTGTLRRNPDMKWKFSQEMLERLIAEQRAIFKEAYTFLKPGGRIVYATCSMLAQENQEQEAYFLEHHPVEVAGAPFQTLPAPDAMDGFFAAEFTTSDCRAEASTPYLPSAC